MIDTRDCPSGEESQEVAVDYLDAKVFGNVLNAAIGLANDGEGISQQELVDEMNRLGVDMSYRVLRNILTGVRPPKADEVFAFVDILQPPAGLEFFVRAVRSDRRERIRSAGHVR